MVLDVVKFVVGTGRATITLFRPETTLEPTLVVPNTVAPPLVMVNVDVPVPLASSTTLPALYKVLEILIPPVTCNPPLRGPLASVVFPRYMIPPT